VRKAAAADAEEMSFFGSESTEMGLGDSVMMRLGEAGNSDFLRSCNCGIMGGTGEPRAEVLFDRLGGGNMSAMGDCGTMKVVRSLKLLGRLTCGGGTR
jgi:hypothetical protein